MLGVTFFDKRIDKNSSSVIRTSGPRSSGSIYWISCLL